MDLLRIWTYSTLNHMLLLPKLLVYQIDTIRPSSIYAMTINNCDHTVSTTCKTLSNKFDLSNKFTQSLPSTRDDPVLLQILTITPCNNHYGTRINTFKQTTNIKIISIYTLTFTTSFHCSHFWSPLLLSLFASCPVAEGSLVSWVANRSLRWERAQEVVPGQVHYITPMQDGKSMTHFSNLLSYYHPHFLSHRWAQFSLVGCEPVS